MESIYNNDDFELSNVNKEKCSDFEEFEDDDDYINVDEMRGRPTAKDHADVSGDAERKCPSSKTEVILILLLLGALTTVSVLAALYFNQSVSLDEVREQYANATALLEMQVNKTTELKSSLDKVQESYERATEQRDELKSNLEKVQVSYEAAKKQLDSLKIKDREYKELEEKYQHIHEVLFKGNKSCEHCDRGWRPFGLKCYFFSTENLNWMQSRDSCVKKGGHLVVITSQEEQEFLASIITENHWIGLNDLETEGTWMWVNNKTLDETGVKFWFQRPDEPGEPDNWNVEDSSGENCASLGNESGNYYKWFDASCHKVKKYICQT